ncbi:sulfur carrier protein ThiS [Paenibacillus sp. FJAT-26967]|uniref:sulfur carrier protein ThiS n=1 Tax=Paenibacillus sp. FJAT-26967 TaxID=1729690 RepID=UPI0008383153|nr:sulfur carrier protein ThiS [Paenibacillus sp. FJAT-26967]
MKLHVNGDAIEVPDESSTIAGLLEHLGLSASLLVVETNGRILQAEDHTGTPIMDGDRIEIVHFVGGG